MGGQHYKYTPYFHRDESQFKELWVRDEIKEDYACSHGRYIEIDLRKVKTVEDAIKNLKVYIIVGSANGQVCLM